MQEAQPLTQNDPIIIQEPQFNSTEFSSRYFAWNETDTSKIYLECPEIYDEMHTSFDFKVKSAYETILIVEGSEDGTSSIYEQAQHFNIPKKSFLSKLEIFVGGNKAVQHEMQIRNNTYDGTILYRFDVNLSYSGWLTIDFSPEIKLDTGDYFLWMESNSLPSNKAWYRDIYGLSHNNTETWIFNGISWIMAEYDLTLKVYSYEMLNPVDVAMTINDLPVLNRNPGEGNIELKNEITSSLIVFNVVTNTSIRFSYCATAEFFRNISQSYSYEFVFNVPNWEIRLNLVDPGLYYSGYHVNLSGIFPDYYEIQIHNNQAGVAYSYISNNIITFDQAATDIRFKSPNYIQNIDLESKLISTNNISTTISTLGSGIIYYQILSNNLEQIYETYLTVDDSNSIVWETNPIETSGIYTIQLYFYNQNELGYSSSMFEVIREANLLSQNLVKYALDTITLDCNYYDSNMHESIKDAEIRYLLQDLNRIMEYSEDTKNYTCELDMDVFSFIPGEYNITFSSHKEGFEDNSINQSFKIIARPLMIHLSQNISTINPGDTILFGVTVIDVLTGNSLKRPVDLVFQIYSNLNSSISSEERIMNIYLSGISQYAEFEWKSPTNLEAKNYTIKIKSQNLFYEGNISISNGILVENFEVLENSETIKFLVITVVLLLIIIMLIYIRKKKQNTKRSIGGMMVFHPSGVPLAEIITPQFSKNDPMLISGAITGVITIIREITGQGLRVIEIEDGFVNISKGKNFWLVIFLKKNPNWIKRTLKQIPKVLERRFGKIFEDWDGTVVEICLSKIIQRYFHTQLENNVVYDDSEELEKFEEPEKPEVHEPNEEKIIKSKRKIMILKEIPKR